MRRYRACCLSPPWPLAGLRFVPLHRGPSFSMRVRSTAPWPGRARSSPTALLGFVTLRSFAPARRWPDVSLRPGPHAVIERPSRSVFIGRSAASFALRPPLELEARPIADVQSGFWDLALRAIRTALQRWLAAAWRGRDCLGLFLSQACRHPTDGCAHADSTPHGPSTPGNRLAVPIRLGSRQRSR